jgi:hypothetical protein
MLDNAQDYCYISAKLVKILEKPREENHMLLLFKFICCFLKINSDLSANEIEMVDIILLLFRRYATSFTRTLHLGSLSSSTRHMHHSQANQLIMIGFYLFITSSSHHFL